MEATRVSLLERLRGDSADPAWEDFYGIYGLPIVRYARRQGLDEASAFDVLQESMVVLMRLLPEFRYDPGRGKFRNFLLTIVHRKGLDAIRRRARRTEVPLDAPAVEDGQTVLDTLADPSTVAPSAKMEADWRASLFEEALRRVRNDPRVDARTLAVFLDYAVKDGDAVEVARRHGIKENAVYQIKNRLTKRLREDVRALEEGNV